MSKKNLLIGFFILIFLVTYINWTTPVSKLLAYSENIYSRIKIIASILDTVQRVYLEEKDTDELIQDAIRGMLADLDPHTSYLTPQEFKEWNQNFEGYSGIGVSYDIIQNKITIMSVLEKSPAAKVGLRAGDKIIKVNGESVVGLKREEASKKLKGPVGSRVVLKVERNGRRQPLEFQLIRERIYVKSIPYSMMLSHDTGYIKIERFAATTASELEEALRELESRGMKKLILDLRGNSGGYLNAAIDVADKFIPAGNLIVYTRGRLPSTYQEYYATDETTHPLLPLIVLIDHGSASASEIVAGAIQDLDRGLIIGKPSFGKGLVQSQYRFQNGSALLITTARYFTPSGRPIQRNYYNKTKEEYYNEAYNDILRKVKLSSNHQKTYKTISGRIVYGGNGITPDIWVENSENIISDKLRDLIYSDRRYFYTFLEKYAHKHKKLKTDFNHFLTSFQISESLYHQFINFVIKSNPKFRASDFIADKDDIKFIMKRELARILWGEDAQFKVNILRDKPLQMALRSFPRAELLLHMSQLKIARGKN